MAGRSVGIYRLWLKRGFAVSAPCFPASSWRYGCEAATTAANNERGNHSRTDDRDTQIDQAQPRVEVLFEFGPFRGGRGPLFPGGPGCPTAGEVGTVVADDVFLEDGDVAVRRLSVQVPKESCPDVFAEFCAQRSGIDNLGA
ncbi:hypothetical protein AHiyo4_10340 [Arthrobacter sp. Hiyo4]|nr:hypothetical protein AHiyo4_10340 [Arthrobacter sp. Hiyo4]